MTTCNPRLRRPVLYPVELRARDFVILSCWKPTEASFQHAVGMILEWALTEAIWTGLPACYLQQSMG